VNCITFGFVAGRHRGRRDTIQRHLQQHGVQSANMLITDDKYESRLKLNLWELQRYLSMTAINWTVP